MAEIGSASETVVIVGWDVDNEPALLMHSDALAQAGRFFRTVYPDGFVAVNEPATRALIVDFDDADFQADEVRLAMNG